MSENAFITVVNGLKHLKANPILLAPGLIYYLVTIFLSIAVVVSVYLILSFDVGFTTFAAVTFSFLVVVTVLSSFTTAGLIGMAREVVKYGYTDFSHLFSYGRKYCVKLIIASVFIWILRSITAVFWAPFVRLFSGSGYTSDYIIEALKNDPTLLLPLLDALGPAALLALFLSSVYLLLVSFMFYFVSYIIVVDNISVFRSYRKSFSLLRRRPIRVSSFVFLTTLLQILATLTVIVITAFLAQFNYFSILGVLFNIFVSLLFVAAMNVWVTRFYLILTNQDVRPLSDN